VDEQHLRIRAQIPNITAATDFILKVGQRAGLDEEQIHHCQLSVDEVCTNIMEHGYGFDNDEGIIDVVVQTQPGRFIIKICDDSRPFNPLERPDPNPKLALADRKNGGWGIFFVKKFMDEVTYDFYKGRNQLTLILNLKPEMKDDIVVTAHPNNVWLVAPRGRLDETFSPKLGKVLTEQLEAGHKQLILDMTKVSHFSPSGLREIMSAYKRARTLRGDLVLAGVTANVSDYFQTAGLDLVFTVFDTVDEALARFKPRK
jgi:anti-anti-sigma factor